MSQIVFFIPVVGWKMKIGKARFARKIKHENVFISFSFFYVLTKLRLLSFCWMG
jgi:hypothetical protein